MKKDKKLLLLILPLIFTILLFVPGIIYYIAPQDFIQGVPDELWNIFLAIKWPALIAWTILFYHIPLGVYVVMLVVYTIITWMYLMRRKKGNVLYYIVWLALCVFSILIYWKVGPEYHSIINM